MKRCSYYETCATYGLNVDRVFQEGECGHPSKCGERGWRPGIVLEAAHPGLALWVIGRSFACVGGRGDQGGQRGLA